MFYWLKCLILSCGNFSKKIKYTYQEYLQLEIDTDIRHEFWNGEVLAMADVTKKHSRIGFNIVKFINDSFRPQGCEAFKAHVKLELQKENHYVYPDVILTCDKEDKDPYSVKNPSLIVEVLSKSKETYDRSVKFAQYRKIKSLRYYLLVSQTAPIVEVYGKVNEGASVFTYEVYEGLDAIIQLPALEFEMPMSKVYDYIEFSEDEKI